MRTIAGIACVALLTLGIARAEDACKVDVEKLCAGIPPGGGRILSCLKANEAQVSPGCKQQVSAIVQKAKELGAACEGDIQQFCADAPKGGGATLRCLAWNGSKLSLGCQQVIQRVQEKAATFKKACGADAAKFCKGIPEGQGRIAACLKSKQAELAPECQTLVATLWVPGAATAATPAAIPAAAPNVPAATPVTTSATAPVEPAAAPGAAPAAAPAAPAAAPAAVPAAAPAAPAAAPATSSTAAPPAPPASGESQTK